MTDDLRGRHDDLWARHRELSDRLDQYQAELHAMFPADPVWTAHDDGTVSMSWPDGVEYAAVGREPLEAVVARINGAPARVTRLERALREVVNVLGPDGVCVCTGPGCGLRDEAAEALRVAREALEDT